MQAPHKSVHLIISGRVQGVGYRAWVERRACACGMEGWVRNRADGTVEAIFSGEVTAVEALIAECYAGPMAARVEDILVRILPEEERERQAGFRRLPTA